MSAPDRPRKRPPMNTDELLNLVAQTRKKVTDAATDLEMLSRELRLRLGIAVAEDKGEPDE